MLGTAFGPKGRELAQQRIVPMLEQQKGDTDADVRYYATRALQKTMVAVQGID
jgi:serine/threonine-protein phosphatase 2A regulatory subunit A